ncbi:MAG TPA: hypothetical protein PLE35_04710, partial [Lentisphaeria bacterium]|nr:hypothetical protein [Lentisphaeria bacterium]
LTADNTCKATNTASLAKKLFVISYETYGNAKTVLLLLTRTKLPSEKRKMQNRLLRACFAVFCIILTMIFSPAGTATLTWLALGQTI